LIAQGNAEIVYSNSQSPTPTPTTPTPTPTPNPGSTLSFSGCANYAYPSMFGTESVQSVLSNGVKTTGGHQLAWGDCTKRSAVKVGDVIYY
jgi:hypothetical protein